MSFKVKVIEFAKAVGEDIKFLYVTALSLTGKYNTLDESMTAVKADIDKLNKRTRFTKCTYRTTIPATAKPSSTLSFLISNVVVENFTALDSKGIRVVININGIPFRTKEFKTVEAHRITITGVVPSSQYEIILLPILDILRRSNEYVTDVKVT